MTPALSPLSESVILSHLNTVHDIHEFVEGSLYTLILSRWVDVSLET